MNEKERGLEERKLDITERELTIKEAELEASTKRGRKQFDLISPFGVAAIGGTLTLLTALLGNFIQGYNSARIEYQKNQSALVLKAIDTNGDTDQARANLKFFVEAGLIDDNGKISHLVDKAEEEGGVPIPSLSPVRGPREMEIRYFVVDLPTIESGENAILLLAEAIEEWQKVARIVVTRTDSKESANVIISKGTEGNAFCYAHLGPPAQGAKLEMHFADTKWKAKDFRAGACREFGHILGLTNSDTPGVLMSRDATLDDSPGTPKPEDIKRIQEIWSFDANSQKSSAMK